jgi:hypothetical protein
LRVTAIDLVAGIIEQLEKEPEERGRPRLPAAEGSLRRYNSFCAKAFSGADFSPGPAMPPVRRRLREWRDVALLPRVHAAQLRRTRSSPEAATRVLDIVVDSCSVRAKHGGDGAGGGRGAGRGISLPSHRGPDPIRIEL